MSQLINCSALCSETPFMAPLHDVQHGGRELDLEEDLPPVDLPGLLSRCVCGMAIVGNCPVDENQRL